VVGIGNLRYNAHLMLSWAKLGLKRFEARGRGGTRPVFRPAAAMRIGDALSHLSRVFFVYY